MLGDGAWVIGFNPSRIGHWVVILIMAGWLVTVILVRRFISSKMSPKNGNLIGVDRNDRRLKSMPRENTLWWLDELPGNFSIRVSCITQFFNRERLRSFFDTTHNVDMASNEAEASGGVISHHVQIMHWFKTVIGEIVPFDVFCTPPR